MVQKKSIPLCIILSIVTCGIYGIVWFIELHDATKTLSDDNQDTTAVIAFLLTLVTCGIYGIYWFWKRGTQMEKAFKARGMSGDNKAILYLILCVVGLSIISMALLQNDVNILVDGGTN